MNCPSKTGHHGSTFYGISASKLHAVHLTETCSSILHWRCNPLADILWGVFSHLTSGSKTSWDAVNHCGTTPLIETWSVDHNVEANFHPWRLSFSHCKPVQNQLWSYHSDTLLIYVQDFWHSFCRKLSHDQNVVNDVTNSIARILQSLSYDFSWNYSILSITFTWVISKVGYLDWSSSVTLK